MNKIVAVLFLLLGSTHAWAADKPNPAGYPIKVHISATHMLLNSDGYRLYADAILDGKKFELAGWGVGVSSNYALIVPGDYLARLIKDFHNTDRSAIYKEYDVLLTDGTVWRCTLSGISE
jgi:hypothetical protein